MKTYPGNKLIDRLYNAVAEKGHVCLGLDTDYSYLPDAFGTKFASPAEAVYAFNREVIDATLDVSTVYKVQIAYYEAMGLAGLDCYAKTLAYLREKKAIVIADVKRGDIAKTAEMYAQAHFTGDFEADFITVNPFMGMDTLKPFYPYLEKKDKGLFVLVATSNPGANDIEGILAADGESVSEKTGAMVAGENAAFLGESGYGMIGAVVGCTNKNQTDRIRARLENVFFLIPGYGAQGGKAEDMKYYFKDGNGGVVNSSRGILLARNKPEFAHLSFAEAARAECVRMREDIQSAL
ncbi:orotidine-5'-phosphate decarboxylase [Ruminococcaceae bacterium OttesenSCG-928-L11]|nr:orotidine-5'-phosphate decarboxylase [Ruminococcaceae bacterium OttesenSCG-928-L11]